MNAALHPRFPDVHLPHLSQVAIPPLARVRLRQPRVAPLADPLKALHDRLDAHADLFALAPGASVAVVVGSRGIARIDAIARTAVDWLTARGLSPFIVPGMGSHGGGRADGQRAVLAQIGITEEAIGCPVRATMDTVTYGEIEGGLACHFDAHAAAADGVLVINRVKAHTSFPRPVESGLTKMLAVGLGKADGARQVHRLGPRGLLEVLPRLAARIVECAPLRAGVAVVENADKAICALEVVAPREFYDCDQRLLVQAKAAMARLPLAQLDGLVIEEIGKEISGAGIDPAISGRTDIRGVDNPSEPFIHKIVALSMTAKTAGNGIGVGMVDYIPRRLADALDLHAMYMNAVTATILEKAFIPIVLPTDRACLQALVATGWSAGAPRLCQIRSSAHLDRIAVSAPVLDELREAGHLLEESAPATLAFDEHGTLVTRLGEAA